MSPLCPICGDKFVHKLRYTAAAACVGISSINLFGGAIEPLTINIETTKTGVAAVASEYYFDSNGILYKVLINLRCVRDCGPREEKSALPPPPLRLLVLVLLLLRKLFALVFIVPVVGRSVCRS